MSDQQRLDTVSAYGLECICRTPHIDAMAARGVRFDHAFTPTAICSPARASFLTGLFPHHHGVTGNEMCLKPGIRGIGHYLGEAGYECGYAGKWHIDERLGPSQFGFRGKDFLGYAFPGSGLLPGLRFEQAPVNTPNHYEAYLREAALKLPTVSHRFVGTNPACGRQEMFALHEGPVESCIEYFVADEAIRLMREMAHEQKPFFLWANFWGPHSPSLVPEPYFSMYDPRSIPEHPSYRETFEKKPRVQAIIERMWGLGDYGWAGFQEIAARYFGHCTLIDDQVGRIVAELERLGQLDNTIVVYTSDHGDCLGAHKLIEKGEFMYDEIYRIPMVVALPACVAKGSVNSDFVYLHDLMPTFIEAGGARMPHDLDCRSILPALRGEPLVDARDDVFCIFDRHFTVANQRMVRTRTHQFTFNPGDIGELYDLEKDPWQLDNRHGDPRYEAVRRDLMARMDRHMEALGDPQLGWFRQIGPVY